MFLGWIKNNRHYFYGLAILLFVIIINIFPRGYVFGGGDTIQLINASESFIKLLYDWHGNGSLFYIIFFLLDRIGISDTAQLSFYLGVFIIGSYASFDIFSRLVFRGTQSIVRMLLSLFYALNLFTLYVFTANWGFSYYLSLYIFIPVLFGLFYRFLKSNQLPYGLFFVGALFLGSSGFGNPAFAISFAIFISLALLLLWLAGEFNVSKKLIRNTIIIAILAILVNAYWILPTIPMMRSGVENLFSGNAIELNWALSHTANPIMNTIRLMHYSGDYFPDNFIYNIPLINKNIFRIVAFLPFLLCIVGLFFINRPNNTNKRLILVAFGSLLIFIMLVARVTPPFEVINYYIFNTWGMNTLRGYDKAAIFLPFIISFILLIFFQKFTSKKFLSLLVIIILIPLPFFTGKIQQNLSYRFANSSVEKKDYTKSSLSFLLQIPDEYYGIKKILDSDNEKSFIATLPSGSNDGTVISHYPKWKLYGADITKFLYSKEFIEANGIYFKNWNFAEDFGKAEADYLWIAQLLGSMNSRYTLYHKDAPTDSVEETEYKMRELEKLGSLEKIQENNYFILYKIRDDLFIPYITWQKNSMISEVEARSIKNNLDAVIKSYEKAEFREMNRRKFIIDNIKESRDIVLSEVYDNNWKAYAIDRNGHETEIRDHFLARGYANGWKIDHPENVAKIIIEYYPIRLMWRGMAISFTTVLFLLVYLARPVVLKLFRKSKVLHN